MKLTEFRKLIREEVREVVKNPKTPIQVATHIGYNVGPNTDEEIDQNSTEAVYIKTIADRLYNTGYPLSKLDKDEIISAFVGGYVNSAGSSDSTFQYRNNKLSTIIKVLSALALKGWPKKGRVLGS